jgi:RNA polymerase sigma factor for flagellar operon FliA
MATKSKKSTKRETRTHAPTKKVLGHLSRDHTQSLWEAYRRTKDRALRNRLLERYFPLVRRVAEKILTTLPKSVELDDLVSAGTFGLVDAIDGFDIHRGIQFKTYCSTRIRGAILDELRAQDWVPRLVRIRSHQLERARRALEVETGREPTDVELAKKLGISVADLTHLREEAAAKTMFSMSETKDEDDERAPEGISRMGDPRSDSPMELYHRKDLFDVVTKSLTPKERDILRWYYFAGLTLKEIGRRLGLTESRVCQIHSNVTARLRVSLDTIRPKLSI